ncbi:hypothetical protein [Azospirillum picis]|uniref:Zn-binding protein involved in type VI secretion n=1 Tax=Azospirillum picis TaxID=488438 RepID=A0ABU0MSV3_9PROT|nr:hypothetical protein [Azospirillum picis]MBP2302796.1 putative Zn-binding protein involved in type VI secretion [Azospirillum picis]MDQ0536542.1 putative Zn-binding protein involved in type VI secretion [Azospirillum picis]
MPGPLLHLGATVMCSHGGQAMPTAPNPRVLVSGQPVATMASPYAVAGCSFVPPGGNGPCVTAQWVMAATRVLVAGQPAILLDSQSLCTPTGTPLVPTVAQTRVIGS